jgi:type IV pilus assembly protein PilA
MQRRGFTLIELLLVMGLMAILSSIVIAALSPTRQLASGRDTKRVSDVNTILNAVYQYSIDHAGNFPSSLVVGPAKGICKTGLLICNNGVNLNALSGSYLVSIPEDPNASTTGTGTEYFIQRLANGRLTISAPLAEGSDPIVVTR